jgi:hypothetical protein
MKEIKGILIAMLVQLCIIAGACIGIALNLKKLINP